MGGFNYADIDWSTFALANRDKALSETLVDLALLFHLAQEVETPTRKLALLDIVFF